VLHNSGGGYGDAGRGSEEKPKDLRGRLNGECLGQKQRRGHDRVKSAQSSNGERRCAGSRVGRGAGSNRREKENTRPAGKMRWKGGA